MAASMEDAWWLPDGSFSSDSETGYWDFDDHLSSDSETEADAGTGDRAAHLVEAMYQHLTRYTGLSQKYRKVLAAVLMETRQELKVVALGTGTKCISGKNLDENGRAINDCHAEVIARRAFVGFLYSELERFLRDPEGSIFTVQPHSRLLGLTSEISFHLYISSIPCGDAAVFPQEDDSLTLGRKQRDKRGRARAKIEMGQEGVYSPATPQDWDQLRSGSDRLYTTSCSDKLARWNLLGMQGSLLSIYLDPIYISTVTIGNKFSHTHLHRAISGRIKAITQLPEKYTVNSPKLFSGYTTSDISLKSVDVSLNWSVSLAEIEKVNCHTGRKESWEVSGSQSRLCKHSLFERFLKLWDVLASRAAKAEAAKVIYRKTGIPVLATSEHLKVCLTYGEVKSLAKDYGKAKGKLLEHYESHCGGPWARKPPEQDSFYL